MYSRSVVSSEGSVLSMCSDPAMASPALVYAGLVASSWVSRLLAR
jgi:hypothetical protein